MGEVNIATREPTGLVKELKEFVDLSNIIPFSKRREIERLTLEEEINKIADEVSFGVERNAQTELYVERLKQVYPVVDPKFLSMKHPKAVGVKGDYIRVEYALPRFAFFSLDSPVCRLNLCIDGEYEYGEKKWILKAFDTEPTLPPILRNQILGCILNNCNPKYERLYLDLSWNTFKTRFTTDFNGIIPRSVKEQIRISKEVFGENMYLITEAKEWKASKVPVKDPLVVGVKGDTCFLIDSFDTTPLEEYIKENFSRKEENGYR